MVQSGTISAKAGGVSLAAQNITVNPRSGWALVAVSPTQVPQDENPRCGSFGIPEEPRSGDRLAGACLDQRWNPTPYMVPSGPNHRFHYLTAIDRATTSYKWAMHSNLIRPTTSEFYTRQCGNYNAQLNPTGFISGYNLSVNLERHESGDIQSHYRFYVDAQDSPTKNLGIAAESFIGVPGQSLSVFLDGLNQALSPLATAIWVSHSVEPCGNADPGYDGSCTYQGYTNLYPLKPCP